MRSFPPRFLIQAVSALAIAGLAAGCSGSSPSVPTALVPTAAKPAGPAAQGHLVMKRMPQSQYEAVSKVINAAIQRRATSSGIRTQAFASGIPGGFGYTTSTSQPAAGGPGYPSTPYSGMTGFMTAYLVSPTPANGNAFSLRGVNSSTIGNHSPVDHAFQSLYMPVNLAPGGACLIPYVAYTSDSYNVENYFGILDECDHTLSATDLSDMATNGYITGDSNKTYGGNQIEYQVGQYPANSTGTVGTWYVNLRYWNSAQTYYTVAQSSDRVGVPRNDVSLDNGAGGTFYLENELQPQQSGCPRLPGSSLSSTGVSLLNTSTQLYEPLAASGMPGGGFSGFIAPDLSKLTCFVPTNESGTAYYSSTEDYNMGGDFYVNSNG